MTEHSAMITTQLKYVFIGHLHLGYLLVPIFACFLGVSLFLCFLVVALCFPVTNFEE